jgi:outer membrane protein assembly factor BamB
MNRRTAVALLSLSACVPAAFGQTEAERSWGQWRGARMDGVARQGNPPSEWSETKNVRFKVALPGSGSATPVAWKDRLYVLTAIPAPQPEAAATAPPTTTTTAPSAVPPAGEGGGGGRGGRRAGGGRPQEPIVAQEFSVLAIDRNSGKTVWARTARKELPHEGKQPNNSFASASAITDGENVIAYFGSRGLYCYDMDGNLKWEKDLGDMQTRNGFGEGATPALHGGTLVVNWDHEAESFVAAFDKRTGKELWRRARQEQTTWATPLVVEHQGRRQVITAGTNKVRSYDLESGELVWEAPGLTPNAIPSPIESKGVVYVTAGYRGNAARAIRLAGAKGDLTGTPSILWQIDRDTPYVPSPLLYGDVLYLIKSNAAVLTALDASNGQSLYGPQRLEGLSEIYASPVGAGGRVYIIGRDGNAVVLENGREFKVLANNKLDDGFDASPVVVGDDLYLRGYRHLYRIAQQ